MDEEVPEHAAEATVASLSTGSRSFQMVLPDAGVDYIQSMLAKGQVYEQALLEDMAKRMQQGSLVVDVGANIGGHACYLAASGYRVVAFEPDPHLAAALRQSVALNRLDDMVDIRAVAVGAVPGTGALMRPDDRNLGSQFVSATDEEDRDGLETVHIATILTLDQQAYPDRVAALKIDVEGMELDVLDGAALLLEQDLPMVYVEVLSAEHFRDAYERLGRLGYRYEATFNYSPTHLFVPGETPLDPAVLDATTLLARRMYAAEDSARTTREQLTNANVKYRAATELIGRLRATAKLDEGAVTAGNAEDVAQRAQLLSMLNASHEREVEHAKRIVELQQLVEQREADGRRLADAVEASRGSTIHVDEIRQEMRELETERDELARRLANAREKLAHRRRRGLRAKRKLDGTRAELSDVTAALNASETDLARERQRITTLEARLSAQQAMVAGLRDRLAVREHELDRDRERRTRLKDDFLVLREWIRDAQDRERDLNARIALLSNGEGIDDVAEAMFVPIAELRRAREEIGQLNGRIDRLRDSDEASRRYRAQLVALRGSKTYRLGKAVRDGFSSFRGFLRMPKAILAALREPSAADPQRDGEQKRKAQA